MWITSYPLSQQTPQPGHRLHYRNFSTQVRNAQCPIPCFVSFDAASKVRNGHASPDQSCLRTYLCHPPLPTRVKSTLYRRTKFHLSHSRAMSPEEEEQLFGSVDSESESVADGDSSSSGTDDAQASDRLAVQEHLDIPDGQPPASTAQAERLDSFDREKFQSNVAAIFGPAWDAGRIRPLPHPSSFFDTIHAPQSTLFCQSFASVGVPTMPPNPLATSFHHQLGTLVSGNGVVRGPAPYSLQGQAPSGPHSPHFLPGLSQHRPQYHQSRAMPALRSVAPRIPDYPQPQARHPMLVAGYGDFQLAQPGPTQNPYGRPMAPGLPRECAPTTEHLHPTDSSLDGALNGRLPAATPVRPLTPVLPQPSSHSYSAQLPAPYHYSPNPAQTTGGEIYAFVPFALYTQCLTS